MKIVDIDYSKELFNIKYLPFLPERKKVKKLKN